MNNLKIAKSHNGKCFICGSKRKLKMINKIAIVTAYLNENVFIKIHARCCSSHMNERGLFKPNKLKSIKESDLCLSYQSYQSFKFSMDKIFLSTVSSGIFDLFKDIRRGLFQYHTME